MQIMLANKAFVQAIVRRRRCAAIFNVDNNGASMIDLMRLKGEHIVLQVGIILAAPIKEASSDGSSIKNSSNRI